MKRKEAFGDLIAHLAKELTVMFSQAWKKELAQQSRSANGEKVGNLKEPRYYKGNAGINFLKICLTLEVLLSRGHHIQWDEPPGSGPDEAEHWMDTLYKALEALPVPLCQQSELLAAWMAQVAGLAGEEHATHALRAEYLRDSWQEPTGLIEEKVLEFAVGWLKSVFSPDRRDALLTALAPDPVPWEQAFFQAVREEMEECFGDGLDTYGLKLLGPSLQKLISGLPYADMTKTFLNEQEDIKILFSNYLDVPFLKPWEKPLVSSLWYYESDEGDIHRRIIKNYFEMVSSSKETADIQSFRWDPGKLYLVMLDFTLQRKFGEELIGSGKYKVGKHSWEELILNSFADSPRFYARPWLLAAYLLSMMTDKNEALSGEISSGNGASFMILVPEGVLNRVGWENELRMELFRNGRIRAVFHFPTDIPGYTTQRFSLLWVQPYRQELARIPLFQVKSHDRPTIIRAGFAKPYMSSSGEFLDLSVRSLEENNGQRMAGEWMNQLLEDLQEINVDIERLNKSFIQLVNDTKKAGS